MLVFLLIIWMLQTSLMLCYFSCDIGIAASKFDATFHGSCFNFIYSHLDAALLLYYYVEYAASNLDYAILVLGA